MRCAWGVGGRNEVLNPGQGSIPLPCVGPSQRRGLDPSIHSQLDGESCCPHGRPGLLLFCGTRAVDRQLAGCKVAGNALHDLPWALPGRALQSRVSCGRGSQETFVRSKYTWYLFRHTTQEAYTGRRVSDFGLSLIRDNRLQSSGDGGFVFITQQKRSPSPRSSSLD